MNAIQASSFLHFYKLLVLLFDVFSFSHQKVANFFADRTLQHKLHANRVKEKNETVSNHHRIICLTIDLRSSVKLVFYQDEIKRN